MNVKEAAKYLGRNTHEVKKLAAQGVVPGVKIASGEWFFYEEELKVWLETHPKQTFKLDISTEMLKKMVEGKLYYEVAEKLGVSASDISYRMRKLGIRRYKK